MRRNTALVLGLQGKFDEARQVAALDDGAIQGPKSNMTYLRNMLSNPTQLSAAARGEHEAPADDWEPFDAANAKGAAASKSFAATPMPKMHVVQAAEEIEAPSAAQAKGTQVPAPGEPRRGGRHPLADHARGSDAHSGRRRRPTQEPTRTSQSYKPKPDRRAALRARFSGCSPSRLRVSDAESAAAPDGHDLDERRA